MEAKSIEKIAEELGVNFYDLQPYILMREGISFKAGEDKGKQEGFDKVVEFVNQYALVEGEPDCHLDVGDILICKGFWQAKLKEWGL